jgi:hypothetical protein
LESEEWVKDLKVVHLAGWFGLVGVIFFAIEIPLRVLPGSPPQISDAIGHSQFLAESG